MRQIINSQKHYQLLINDLAENFNKKNEINTTAYIM
jgi:hypothetical protein